MSTELWFLIWSIVVYALYLGAQSLLYRMQHGVKAAGSARDNETPPNTLLGRADRAMRNFHETWPVFIILALIAHLALPGDPLVWWGAVIWLGGRVLFLPLYLSGIFLVRSMVWMIATAGLGLMFYAVVF